MLDIKFIRENKDIVQAGAVKKHVDFNVERLLQVDDERLKKLNEVEELRREHNRISNDIGRDQEPQLKVQLIEEMRAMKEELKEKEEDLRLIMEDWQAIMLQAPNVPDMSVPDGKSDAENQEVKNWGEKPNFGFDPKDHIQIMTAFKMADFERGTKVHGFRGYFLTGEGARLSFAIWNYAMDFFGEKGFVPVIPPVIVRKQNLYGTAHLPGYV